MEMKNYYNVIACTGLYNVEPGTYSYTVLCGSVVHCRSFKNLVTESISTLNSYWIVYSILPQRPHCVYSLQYGNHMNNL